MRYQQHVFMIAVCSLPCLVKDSECVHVNIMCCLSHTQACMGKQQSCRRECSCSMSVEVTVWHDPLNKQQMQSYSLWQIHTWCNAHILPLTEAETLTYIHTCIKYMHYTWPCPDNGAHLRYNLCDSGKPKRWIDISCSMSSWHWYFTQSLSDCRWN